jgi:dephospho-CoA kinase
MPYAKLVVGLTGGIGSGKTTVANLFAEHGVTIIDTDQIARDITQPGQPAFDAIIKYFGTDMTLPTGELNRSRLRKLVFADPHKRDWLEKLLHPIIREETGKQIKLAQSPYCIVVIPLLFETKPNPLIHRILVVDAPEELQVIRTQQRDNISDLDVNAIIKTQVTRKVRLAAADDVIENEGDMKNLIAQVNKLHQFYLTQP